MSGVLHGEWWVLRVLGHRSEVEAIEHGQTWRGMTVQEIDRRIRAADLAYVNGELCEPIEVYNDQHSAERRALREHARTGLVHKVTLTSEL